MSGNNKLTGKEKVNQSQRQNRGLDWGWLVGLGGLALIGAIAILVLQLAMTRPAPGRAAANNSSLNTLTSSSAMKGGSSSENGKGTPQQVAEYVRQQVAQKLELSIEQLQSKLQGGISIQTLATSQKLTVEQWHEFEVTIYQLGYANVVKTGKLSQVEAEHRMSALHEYRQAVLDYLVATDCLGSPPPVQQLSFSPGELSQAFFRPR